MKRRILQIVDTLQRGGPQQQMALVAAGLPAAEFEVHVCALAAGGPLADELRMHNVPTAIISHQGRIDPLVIGRLRGHIQALKPDIVQTWTNKANAYGRWAAVLSRVGNLAATKLREDLAQTACHAVSDRLLARFTKAFVANCHGVERSWLDQGVRQNKIRIIASGIAPLAPRVGDRSQLLCELGLPAGARLLGAVGSLWPKKRIKDLIWATDLMKVIRDDVHLLVIGDGPQRPALERFRRQCRIEDRVHMLGYRSDVPRLLAHLDVYCSATSMAGLPTSLMEAMSVGLPVVASDVQGTDELVMPDETGLLVAAGDRAGLARTANKLLDNPELARRLGNAGKERIATKFTVQSMVDQHAALYREMMD
ncbi:MAG TPA: glycosyltransferase [Pirellulales bacterium]|nr:glycosyltransferase [Pirellulales bacterium]